MQGPSDAELFDMGSVMYNQKSIAYIRTITTMGAGFSAGTLGLTGVTGFLFFAGLYFIASCLILVKMGGDVSKFVPRASAGSFLFSDILGEALSFVLYWTLMYALVHIY